MHNIKDIRKNPDQFSNDLKNRYVNVDVKLILKIDEDNRKLIHEKESLENEKKSFQNQKINHYLKNLN